MRALKLGADAFLLKDADQLSFHQIEQTIADFGKRAQAGKIGIEELSGGTLGTCL